MTPNIKRTHTSHEARISVYAGGRTTEWRLPAEGDSVLEVQTMRDPSAFADLPPERNYLIPPYHWHWFQEESFEVVKGRYIFTLEGVESTYDSNTPKFTIPATARHTFRPDPSYTSACELHISARLSPQPSTAFIASSSAPAGISEIFFRNLYCYLDDCDQQKVEPSLPQLLLFLHSAEVSLAFPGPAPVMRWLSWGFGVVVGVWYGEWWLGLKRSYPEYFDEQTMKVR